MNLIKLIVEIRYSEIPSSLRRREEIVETIVGKKIAGSQGSLLENIVVEDKKNRHRLLISNNRTSFEINQPEDKKKAIELCLRFFERAEKALAWDRIFRIGARSLWIDKRNVELEDLIEKVKETFYKENTISKEAVDIAVDFTLVHNEKKINFILGPMNKAQLTSQFLPPASFEAEKIPETFLFLNYDYYLLKEIDYSQDFFKEFVENALSLGEKKAKETFAMVKR